jgi:predicted DNA-binding protein (MmcQ/YjbR family)
VNVADVVEYCLAMPGAEESYPFGEAELVAKVGGKGFAFIGLQEGTVAVKCGANADDAEHWRQRHPEAIVVSAYIGRYGWNRVTLDGVPDDDIRELLDGSYEDVRSRLPRSKRPAVDA